MRFQSSFPFDSNNMLPMTRSFFTTVLPDNISPQVSTNYVIFEKKIYVSEDFFNEFKRKVYPNLSGFFSQKINEVANSENPNGLQIFYNQNMELYTRRVCNADCSQNEVASLYNTVEGNTPDDGGNSGSGGAGGSGSGGAICPPQPEVNVDPRIPDIDPALSPPAPVTTTTTTTPAPTPTCPPVTNAPVPASTGEMLMGIITSLLLICVWVFLVYFYVFKIWKIYDMTKSYKIIFITLCSLSLIFGIIIIAGVIEIFCVKNGSSFEENNKNSEKWSRLTLIFSIIWSFFMGTIMIFAVLLKSNRINGNMNNRILFNNSSLPFPSLNILNRSKLTNNQINKIRNNYNRTGNLPDNLSHADKLAVGINDDSPSSGIFNSMKGFFGIKSDKSSLTPEQDEYEKPGWFQKIKGMFTKSSIDDNLNDKLNKPDIDQLANLVTDNLSVNNIKNLQRLFKQYKNGSNEAKKKIKKLLNPNSLDILNKLPKKYKFKMPQNNKYIRNSSPFTIKTDGLANRTIWET